MRSPGVCRHLPRVTAVVAVAAAMAAVAGMASGATERQGVDRAVRAVPLDDVTYRVYATIYEPNPNTPPVQAAVPDECVKFAALGWTSALRAVGCSPSGYSIGADYAVRVQFGSAVATIPVQDVGPWNVNDNYWDPVCGPRPRREFAGLPQGTPEAQAAFENGYNGRASDSDPHVTNPAGIDLSPAAAAQLGMPGSEWVDVSFLWGSGGVASQGYWSVGSDGAVYACGNAGFFGSMGGHQLNQPVVGMARTADRGGYWLVASDGGIFSFGDAGFFGSMGGHRLNRPIVGMASTPDGRGYWLVASDGGIFSFGDAGFFGSMGGHRLNRPIVSMAATGSGQGYWLTAADGGIFAFGNAGFYGSVGALSIPAPAVDSAAS